jgi:predicted nucleotidyltransferase
MKINSKEKIAGFPLLKIRSLLKKDLLNNEITAIFLKTDQGQAQIVLTELFDLGFIKIDPVQITIQYVTTLKGNALANAKAVSSISKGKAEMIFSEFMERVHEVNQNSKYLFKVTKVVLFGSYITDSLTVNDIDIAFEIRGKDDDDDVFMAKHQEKVKEAIGNGKKFKTFIDELGYSETEVIQFLKSRSHYLSLHSIKDGILKRTEVKQVYP